MLSSMWNSKSNALQVSTSCCLLCETLNLTLYKLTLYVMSSMWKSKSNALQVNTSCCLLCETVNLTL